MKKLFAVKDEKGKIWSSTLSHVGEESSWAQAMYAEWLGVSKIDVDDIPGSIARYRAEAESKGRRVVQVTLSESAEEISPAKPQTMKVQKIGRKHGDGSKNYDVRIIDEFGGEAEVSCTSENKADRLVFAVMDANSGCEDLGEVEMNY